MKTHVNKIKGGLIAAAFALSPFSSAFASFAQIDGDVEAKILAGGEEAVDGAPSVAAGDFTGVVSIEIQKNGGYYICTGSVISARHIITAGHCIEDDSGTGAEIDIKQDDYSVRAVFADGGEFTNVISASAINIHPDYDGFANCGEGEVGGLVGACLNDDVAIITLEEEIPEGIDIYGFSDQTMDGTLLTMVGYGTSGNGIVGDAISPSWTDKKIGFNYAEIFDCDDGTSVDSSGGFFNSGACEEEFGNEAETWYADFDGFDADGVFQNFWCELFDLGCDEVWLGEDFTDPYDWTTLFEASIGGGDSGGPSFVYNALTDEFELIANNTFGSSALSGYGAWFGGNVYAAYTDWIEQVIPAPAGIGMMLVALGAFGLRRRRANAA